MIAAKLLQHLPHLENLEVNKFQRDDMDSGSAHQHNTSVVKYNHLKTLSLNSYHPSRDDELLYIKNTFACLKGLGLGRINGNSWRVTTISKSVLTSFMEFLQGFRWYIVSFGGVSGENWLMKLYCDNQMNVGGDDIKTATRVQFATEEDMSGLNGGFELQLSNSVNYLHPSVQLSYGLSHNGDRQNITRLRSSLINLHTIVAILAVDLNHSGMTVADCFSTLFGTTHANLKIVCIVGGNMHELERATDLPPNLPCIEELIFQRYAIAEDVLPLLSKSFPTLDTLGFSKCQFADAAQSGEINVNMPNTIINILEIDMDGFERDFILLSVRSMDEDISQYYLDNATSKITKATFNNLKGAISQEKRIAISANFKSIRNIKFYWMGTII